MKKHVIAAAVAAAFAVPAMAQVTVSGTLDMGYASKTVEQTLGEASFKGYGNEQSLSTSEFVLSGTEDLGGGLKAFFRLSQQIGSTTDTVAEVISSNNGTLGNRDAFVGISGGFGSLQTGRFTPVAETIGNSFVYGTVNFLGHSLDTNLGTGSFVGTATAGDFAAMSVFTPYARAANLQVELGRNHGVLQYTSPNLGGFQVMVSHQGTDAVDVGDGFEGTLKGTQYGATFTSGPLRIGATTAKLEVSDTTTGGADVAEATTSVFGVEYDMKVAKFALAYGKTESKLAGTTENDMKMTSFSVMAPLGGGVSVNATYGKGDNENVTNDEKMDLITTQIGINYDISKRTTLYGIWGKNTSEGDTNGELKADGYAIGVRHRF